MVILPSDIPHKMITPSNSVVVSRARYFELPSIIGGSNPTSLEKSQAYYSIALVKAENLYSPYNPDIVPIKWKPFLREGEETEAVYSFFVAPQTLNLSEPFAVTVTATQDGGMFTESNGQVFKNISMSGTTGWRPNPKVLEAGTSESLDLLDTLPNKSSNITSNDILKKTNRKIPDTEVSGFQEFLILRNLFRYYADIKRTKRASEVLMMFINLKEGEAYVVEPITFNSERSTSNRFHFKYSIQFKGLQYFWNETLSGVGTREREKDIDFEKRGSREPFDRTSSALNRALSSLQKAKNTVAANWGRVTYLTNALASSLGAAVDLGSEFLNMPDAMLSTLEGDLDSIVRSLGKAVIASNEFNNDLLGTNGGGTFGVANRFRKFKESLYSIPKLGASGEYTAKGSRATERNESLYQAATDGRSPYNPQRGRTTAENGQDFRLDYSNPFSYVIGQGETTEDIAFKLYGTRELARAIIDFNGLEYPYISERRIAPLVGPFTPSPKVRYTGDTILVPNFTGEVDNRNNVFVPANAVDETDRQTYLDRRMGTDLELEYNPTTKLYDLKIRDGNFALVRGKKNILQSYGIKLGIEQGDLSFHPDFGLAPIAGQKASAFQLFRLQQSIKSTLLSDGRTDSVSNMEVFLRGGNTADVKVFATLKDSNEQIDFAQKVGV